MDKANGASTSTGLRVGTWRLRIFWRRVLTACGIAFVIVQLWPGLASRAGELAKGSLRALRAGDDAQPGTPAKAKVDPQSKADKSPAMPTIRRLPAELADRTLEPVLCPRRHAVIRARESGDRRLVELRERFQTTRLDLDWTELSGREAWRRIAEALGTSAVFGPDCDDIDDETVTLRVRDMRAESVARHLLTMMPELRLTLRPFGLSLTSSDSHDASRELRTFRVGDLLDWRDSHDTDPPTDSSGSFSCFGFSEDGDELEELVNTVLNDSGATSRAVLGGSVAARVDELEADLVQRTLDAIRIAVARRQLGRGGEALKVSRTPGQTSAAHSKILAAIRRPWPTLKLPALSLNELAARLRRLTGINIVVVGDGDETLPGIELQDVTLEEVLAVILRGREITASVRDEALVLSADADWRALEIEVFATSDLASFYLDEDAHPEDVEVLTLIETIQENIGGPDGWTGPTFAHSLGDVLIVRQTPENLDRIRAFLEQLRADRFPAPGR